MEASVCTPADLSTLIRKRGYIKARVTRIKTFVDSYKVERDSSSALTSRLKALDDCFRDYDVIQTEISLLSQQEDAEELQRISFEDNYFGIKSKLQDLLEPVEPKKAESKACADEQSQFDEIKIPHISLPKFSGQYDDWTDFHSAYADVIHNSKRLSNVQKFYYLRSCLSDEALKVIRDIKITSENYISAWKALEKRFQNRRLIVKAHVRLILEIMPLTKPSASGLRQLYDTCSSQISSLKNLNEPVEQWSTLLEGVIEPKLDPVTRDKWEIFNIKQENQDTSSTDNQHSSSTTLNSFDIFMNFLNEQCRILEAKQTNPSGNHVNTTTKNQQKRELRTTKYISSHYGTNNTTPYNNICQLCKEGHSLYLCKRFEALSVDQRQAKARELQLCLNCLRTGHKTIQCKSPYTCKQCNKRHHSLLHFENKKSNVSSEVGNHEAPNTSVVGHSATSNHETVLATAMIRIMDHSGNWHTCRALLDSGSQSHFMNQSLATLLGLNQSRTSTSICGINHNSTYAKFMVTTSIKSKLNDFIEEGLEFLILNKITNDLPVKALLRSLTIPSGLPLADPQYYQSRKVDVLLGADIFYKLLLDGRLRSENTILQNTVLGWVVSGRAEIMNTHSHVKVSNSTIENDSGTLENLLTSFWKVENIIPDSQVRETNIVEQHYSCNTKRCIDGQYMVMLPFSQDPTQVLGPSRQLALKRFLLLERRLNKDKALKTMYEDFLNEYLENNEMELVVEESEPSHTYYLPHHPVIKESSTTTRLRVVFDASARTLSAYSLNSILMTGPTIQRELFSILLSFRIHAYVFTADIKQMYRKILVSEGHRDFQRILWRSEPCQPIQTFRLKTVTYGTASAPFLAIRTLHQLASDEETSYPIAAPIVRRDFYVDDVLTGGDDLNYVVRLQTQLIKLLSTGKFELRKWCVNHPTLLENIDEENIEANFLLSDGDESIKTLGIFWHPLTDTFRFKINLDRSPAIVTKRLILSDISRLFDPLGLLSPVLIAAKLFMQEIWRLKEPKWDDPVPEEIASRWMRYREDLPALNDLTIKRRVVQGQKSTRRTQLHGFSDASTRAYGACIYLRTELNDSISTELLCSKSKVAPIKSISLPRLELCGALLLSQLLQKCLAAIDRKDLDDIILWTDSTIVLHWLSASPDTWQTFVANRISQIQDNTSGCTWKHVRSQHNPADLISRSVSPTNILDCDIWWKGPSWLSSNEKQWPASIHDAHIDPEVEEKRRSCISGIIVEEPFDLQNKYSSWEKLLRITALCQRFIFNCKNPQGKQVEPLLTTDLERAELFWLGYVQRFAFQTEIQKIRNNTEVQGKLGSLSPFIDVNGLLRVGGRLKYAQVDSEQKYPFLLPKDHYITRLLFWSVHIKTLHSGPQLLLATIRTKYWPINGRYLARSTVRNCLQCKRTAPKPAQHLMGDLPSYRVQPAHPFFHCGIDYCGPIYFKRVLQRRSSPVKSYVAIFICMVTKAIHIELVIDLTTKKFLQALQRVIARRGKIRYIYSDNASTFIGARNELNDLKKIMEDSQHKDEVARFCAASGIIWSFIPPRSPHFGGLWEAGVKVVKGHLKRVIGNQILTFDELQTVLILIEGCVNSRPLTSLSSDPNDLNPLTPAHFLIGESLTSLPIPYQNDLNLNRMSRWQLIQDLYQTFWKRWSNEYLSTLQQRTKWTKDFPPPEPGTLVLIKEENRAPLHWELGRIVNLHYGGDGKARVANVKTKRGILKRCLAKLCPLPSS